MTFSLVNRLPSLAAIGDIKAKAINGKLVNNPTLQFDNPTSSRMVLISGPTDVIAGRRLKATMMIPATTKNLYN